MKEEGKEEGLNGPIEHAQREANKSMDMRKKRNKSNVMKTLSMIIL